MSDAATKILSEFIDHCNYINAISDLIFYCYTGSIYEKPREILRIVEKDLSYFNKIKRLNIGSKNKAITNLRNAWYHELAFLEPIGDERENRINRMKFSPWKIIQFYYSIYSGISAMTRCINNQEKIGHKKMINIFTHNLLTRKELSKKFFVSPFCFVLNRKRVLSPAPSDVIKWSYGITDKCPILENCLLKILKKGKVSIFHYFWELRNWVNYQDSYIFRRLYGKSLKWNLDHDMHVILNTFLTLTELYMIMVFGYDKIKEDKDIFVNDFNKYFESNIENDQRLTSYINKRFEIHEDFL